MRLFLGRLQGVQNIVTMAFFEGFIQRFMSYLADLAGAQGSVNGYTPTSMEFATWLTRRNYFTRSLPRWRSIRLIHPPTC